MGIRRQVFVVCSVVVPLCGCGGGPSASRAYDHFVAAAKALETGDKETAFSELSASIDKSPSSWAYFERSRLYLDQGKEQEAVADCQKGLELDPGNIDLKWLAGELKKPPPQRFKGRFAKPPSSALKRP